MQLQRNLVGDSAGLAAIMLNHGRILLLGNRIDQARRQMFEQFTDVPWWMKRCLA